MIVGAPKETKNAERRVGLTPESVRELVAHGHGVVVETSAGIGIGAVDDDYVTAGARIGSVDDVWNQAELIVKVKEPQAVERARLRPDQTLFTYLHLAPDPDQTRELVDSGATCIAYETVTDEAGGPHAQLVFTVNESVTFGVGTSADFADAVIGPGGVTLDVTNVLIAVTVPEPGTIVSSMAALASVFAVVGLRRKG